MSSYHQFPHINKIETFTEIDKTGTYRRKLILKDKLGKIIAHIVLCADNKDSLKLPDEEI